MNALAKIRRALSRRQPTERTHPHFTGLPPGPEHDRAVREGRDFYVIEDSFHTVPTAEEAQAHGGWQTVRALTEAEATDPERYWNAQAQLMAHHDGFPGWRDPEAADRYLYPANYPTP